MLIERRSQHYRRCQGAVLIVSLMLLLAMTLIGIAAIDTSSLQSQMANNSLKARNLYQASLSEIATQTKSPMNTTWYLTTIQDSDTEILNALSGITTSGPGFNLADTDFITHDNTDAVHQSGAVVFRGTGAATESSLKDFQTYNYEINVISVVTGTSAISNQTQGVARLGPKAQQ